MRLSREKLLAEFRQRILSECLYACEPSAKDELRVMPEKMVRDDPVGHKMAIVQDNDSDRSLVMNENAVEESIKRRKGRRSFGTCEIRSQVDRRERVIAVCSISMGGISEATRVHCVKYADKNGSSQAARP